jgi:hypothetical protein
MENEIEKLTKELENDLVREINSTLWSKLPKLNFYGMEKSEMASAVAITFIEHNMGIKYEPSREGKVVASKLFYEDVRISVILRENMRLLLVKYAIFMGVPEYAAKHHLFVEDLFNQYQYAMKYLQKQD